MKKNQVIALFLCYCILPSFSVTSEKPITDINNLVDVSLEDVMVLLKKQNLDSIPAPNAGTELTGLFGITIGEVGLKNGVITGLNTLYRRDGIVITYKKGTFNIEAHLGLKTAALKYDYAAKLFGIGPSGTVTGTVDNLKITIGLNFNIRKVAMKLTKFTVNDSGVIQTEFTGSVLTDAIADILSSAVANLFRGIILKIAEHVFRKTVEDTVDGISNKFSQVLKE